MIPEEVKRKVVWMVARGMKYTDVARELKLQSRSSVAGILYRERTAESEIYREEIKPRPITLRRFSWEDEA